MSPEVMTFTSTIPLPVPQDLPVMDLHWTRTSGAASSWALTIVWETGCISYKRGMTSPIAWKILWISWFFSWLSLILNSDFEYLLSEDSERNKIPFISSWWTDHTSTRRRSRSSSDATHDVESWSTKDVRKETSGTFNVTSMLSSNCCSIYSLHWVYRPLDQRVEAQVTAISSKTLKIQFKQERNWKTQRVQRAEFAQLLNTRCHSLWGCISLLPVYELCRRQRL